VIPLLVIWYIAGLYALLLVAVDARRRARVAAIDWRRFALTTGVPMVVGSALFAIWPMVAWALAQGR